MSMAAPKTSSIESSVPWVEGLTIGQALAATATRNGNCDALVFPQLGLRMSYREFLERVDRRGPRPVGPGHRPGEHVAVWATNVPRMGDFAIRHGPDRRRAGDDQSGLSAVRAGIRAEAKRRRGAVSGRSLQEVRLLRHAGGSLPRAGDIRARQVAMPGVSPPALGRRAARHAAGRRHPLGRNAAAAPKRAGRTNCLPPAIVSARPSRSTSNTRPARPAFPRPPRSAIAICC